LVIFILYFVHSERFERTEYTCLSFYHLLVKELRVEVLAKKCIHYIY